MATVSSKKQRQRAEVQKKLDQLPAPGRAKQPPQVSDAAIQEEIDKMIALGKWAIICENDETTGRVSGYTVGMCAHGMPEFVASGLPNMDELRAVLNAACISSMEEGATAPKDGDTLFAGPTAWMCQLVGEPRRLVYAAQRYTFIRAVYLQRVM